MSTIQDLVPKFSTIELFLRSGRFILFIGNIDRSCNVREELIPMLTVCGMCSELISAMVPSGKQFVAVDYKAYEPLKSAKRLLRSVKLNHSLPFIIDNYPPTVELPPFLKQLYVTNFNEWIDKEVLLVLFRPYGPVIQLDLYRSVYGCRYALVTFASTFSCEVARTLLDYHQLEDGFPIRTIDPPPVYMRNHQPGLQQQDGWHQAAYVRVSGIVPSVNEEKLRQLFERYESLSHFSLVRSFNQRSLGIAFLRFTSMEGTYRAVAALNGRVLEGSMLLLKVVKPSTVPRAFD